MSDNTASAIDHAALLEFTTKIVTAYAGKAKLSPLQLTETIGAVSLALVKIGNTPETPEKPALVPAISIKKSITPDYIICLEDGKKLRMLKRHLAGAYGLTPDQYREKWGLGKDYPMVAPSYALARSQLAKKIGLGKPATKQVEPAPPPKKAAGRKKRASA